MRYFSWKKNKSDEMVIRKFIGAIFIKLFDTKYAIILLKKYSRRVRWN